MNKEDYWWQIVEVDGKLKAKVHDIRNGTDVYLNEESVRTMFKYLDVATTNIALVQKEE